MMDLLQSITILLLGIGVILNAMATRHLIKTVNATNEVLRVAMFYMVVKS